MSPGCLDADRENVLWGGVNGARGKSHFINRTAEVVVYRVVIGPPDTEGHGVIWRLRCERSTGAALPAVHVDVDCGRQTRRVHPGDMNPGIGRDRSVARHGPPCLSILVNSESGNAVPFQPQLEPAVVAGC